MSLSEDPEVVFSGWLEDESIPPRLPFQRFGEILLPGDIKVQSIKEGYFRLRRTRKCVGSSGFSRIEKNEDKLQMLLDVSQFSKEDVDIRLEGNNIVINAKHSEKEDAKGSISREFTRIYVIPSGYSVNDVYTEIDKRGMAIIRIPKATE